MPENACNCWSKEHLKCYLWQAWLWLRDVVTCHQKQRETEFNCQFGKQILNSKKNNNKKMLTTEANWSEVYKLNPRCSHSHLCVWETNIMVSWVPRNQNKANYQIQHQKYNSVFLYKLNPLCGHSHLCVWETNIMVSWVPRNQNKANYQIQHQKYISVFHLFKCQL